MADEPRRASIKGSALISLVDDLNRLRETGAIDDAMLRERLVASDRAMLETAPAAASWYPVDAYARLTGLLVDVSGGDREAFLHERGAKTARRLAETGIYQQLDRATGEADVDPSALAPEDQIREFGRTVRLVVTLSGSMFDFGRWSVSTDPDHPDRFCITIDEAGAMPDVAIATIEGFVNGIGEQSPTVHHLNWTGTRTAPDRIVYTMDAGVSAVYGGAAD